MRTLRLSLLWTVILMLLGSVGGAVVAQDEVGSGSATYVSGLRAFTDWGYGVSLYELEMSDPRADGGYAEFDFTEHGYGGPTASTAALGRVSLVNDEGSWAGHQSAVYEPELGWVLTAWLAGEGPYEGLTLYLLGRSQAGQGRWDDDAGRWETYSTPDMSFEGLILEGPAPHMLEAVDVPTE